jgi:hypothetical protein
MGRLDAQSDLRRSGLVAELAQALAPVAFLGFLRQ